MPQALSWNRRSQNRRLPWWSSTGAHRNFRAQGSAKNCRKLMAVSDQPASRINTGRARVKKPNGSPWAMYKAPSS
jgi:hypothetical protein